MAKTHEGWFINSPKRRVRFTIRRRRRRRAVRNPLGESLVVLGLGGNPRRRRRNPRRRAAMARRRVYHDNARRRYRRNARRYRRRVYHNARRRYRRNVRRYRRRVYHDNVYPRRRRYRHNARRRYRRNPDGRGAMALRWDRPAQWMPLVFSAGLGAATAASVPRMIVGPGVTTWVSYSIEAGVGIVGGIVLPMTGLVRPVTGLAFTLGALGYTVGDMIGRYLFRALGLSAYTFEGTATLADMGQEPRYPPTLSAYAYETAGELADGDKVESFADMGYSPYAVSPYGRSAPIAPWES